MANRHGCLCCCFKLILLILLVRSTTKLPSDDESTNAWARDYIILLLQWRCTDLCYYRAYKLCCYKLQIWQTNSMPPQKIFVLVIWISVACVTKGKLGQLTEEKLKSIYAHYGGDMAIDLEEFKLEVNRWRYRWSIGGRSQPILSYRRW